MLYRHWYLKIKRNKYIRKAVDVSVNILFYLCLLAIFYLLVQVFVVTSFIIPTGSMEPVLIPGDRVLVNKFIPGARLFNLFGSIEGKQVKIYRAPGARKIKRGDIVVFNAPYPSGNEEIKMHIMKYFVKRCAGLPGDSLPCDSIGGISPVYVPKAGDSLVLNHINYQLYHKLIAWEQKGVLEYRDSALCINGAPLTGYRFKKNYYYMRGDNTANSSDSRTWGFIPEEYIAGKAWIVWKSIDPYTGKLRWERMFKLVE